MSLEVSEALAMPKAPAEERRLRLAERVEKAEQAEAILALEHGPPEPRPFLNRLIPERETGLLHAVGGTGKGNLIAGLALDMANGRSFGPFETRDRKPRGILIVSAEEDHEEFARRLNDAAELRSRDSGGQSWRFTVKQLAHFIRFVSVKGLPDAARLGPELRDTLADAASRVPDLGLVVLDPIGRMLPEGVTSLIGTEAAGAVVNELDAVRDATGAAVLAVHHQSKAAIRADAQLGTGASTGSQQLEDYARFVLAMKRLSAEEAGRYGLKSGRHVEIRAVKHNYTALPEEPSVFSVESGGALWPARARHREAVATERALELLAGARAWLTTKAWEEACREVGIARDDARRARANLVDGGQVEAIRGGRNTVYHAPAARGADWPERPTR